MAFIILGAGVTPHPATRRGRLSNALCTRRPTLPTAYRARRPGASAWSASAGAQDAADGGDAGAGAATPKILICGAPASGKGTQCATIVAEYGVVHISTGDMLRAAVKAGTALGREAQSYMDAGRLVPDGVVTDMLIARLREPDCAARGWLLDGFPRTAAQAKALAAAAVLPAAAVVLDVPDAVLVERVVGRRLDPDTGAIYHTSFNPPPSEEVAARLVQRADDTEEKARVRLATFRENAAAVEEHYANILVRVDGNRAKAAVFEDIRAAVDKSLAGDSDADGGGDGGGDGSGEGLPDENASTKGIPVAEFVRRAEAAYEKGLLEPEDVNWSGQAAMDGPGSDGTKDINDVLRRPDIAAGDALAFLLFAYIGRASHGHPVPDLVWLKTALPFLMSWFVIAPFAGAYTRAATQNIKDTLAGLVLPWAASVPAGIGLRAAVTHHSPPVPFVVVTLASTAVILTVWRVAYVKVRGPESSAFRRGGPLEGIQMVTNLLRRW